MKSAGIIYRQYRQIRKKHLYDFAQECRRIDHKNCIYGKTAHSEVCPSLRLCLYGVSKGQEPDLCTNPEECNAFINKWNKEKAIKAFEDILSNYDLKQKYYADLIALEWVLDKDLHMAQKEPNFLGIILLRLIILMEHMLRTFGKSTRAFKYET